MRYFNASGVNSRRYFPCDPRNQPSCGSRDAQHPCSIGECSRRHPHPDNRDVQPGTSEPECQSGHRAPTSERKHDASRHRELTGFDLCSELEPGVHMPQRTKRRRSANRDEVHLSCETQITGAQHGAQRHATHACVSKLGPDPLGNGVRNRIHVVPPADRDCFCTEPAGVNRGGKNMRRASPTQCQDSVARLYSPQQKLERPSFVAAEERRIQVVAFDPQLGCAGKARDLLDRRRRDA